MGKLAAAALALGWLVAAGAAQAVTWNGEFLQGGLVTGRTDPGGRVLLDGKPVRVGADGRFILGFNRDAKAQVEIVLIDPQGRRETLRQAIAARTYDIQRINGMPPAQVTPPPDVLARIRKESAEIAATRSRDTDQPWFASGWIWPVHGVLSGIYGSQRILNGEPREAHYGIDIAAPAGTPVLASTDGEVALAEPDLYFNGGTVIIDHGYGLSAAYIHLQRLSVKTGQRVKQGEQIGTLGATGRTTGPNLHWQVSWFDVHLDPQRLLPPQ